MKQFVSADREQGMLMPYDVRMWLPEAHLARFVVDIVEGLDFKHIYNQYKGVGSTPYDPKLLMVLLFYGYATGVFSSRKIEQGTYDSVAFRFIAGNHHPDHDTISSFRKRFLPEIKGMFKEILLIGKELKLVKMGNIYIDGIKVQANASRHRAMSYEYMKKLEQQLESEIETLLNLANKQDEKEALVEVDIPEEIRLRKDRLEKIKEAKQIVEDRAAERYKKEKEDYDQNIQQRKEKQDKTGKKPRGRAPKPPVESPDEKDQCNFTDSESRIMKTSRGFDQCYNGQAAVNEDMLVVGAYCNAHVNDKQEFVPAIEAVPHELGEIENAVADTGYFSEKNITDCEQKGIRALISTARDKHNSFLDKLLNTDKQTAPAETPIEKMQQKLRKHKDIYKKRKQTVEPVFGIIKEIMGFRRFSLRGEVLVDGEWSLVCSAYNLKRMFNLSFG